MKKPYLLGQICLAVLALLVCVPRAGAAVNVSKRIVAYASLSGDNCIPKVSSTGKGLATLQISRNFDTIYVIATVTDLLSRCTKVELHRGGRNDNGPVNCDLELYRKDTRVYAVITGGLLPSGLIADIINEETYIVFKTEKYGDGEIRGQFLLAEDDGFSAVMDERQVVGSETDSSWWKKSLGLTVISVDASEQFIEINSLFRGLYENETTFVTLNFGSRGQNGPVAIDLTRFVEGDNRIHVKIKAKDFPTDFLDELYDGDIYIQVTTGTRPNGAIRGQLKLIKGLAFYEWGDAKQEVQDVASNGLSLGLFNFNRDLDGAGFFFLQTDLNHESKCTGASLRLAPLNVDGPIVVDLFKFVKDEGLLVAGELKHHSINKALITNMIDGNIYFNLETQNYPRGEIRGQMLSFLRLAYAFDLCGYQTVPKSDCPGYGTGYVSLANDASNVHFIVAADKLTGPIIFGHFHKGKYGTEGNIVKNIYFKKRYAEDFWFNNSDTPLTGGFVNDIINGNAYVNIHTDRFPAGEIRGQIVRGAPICATQYWNGVNEPFAAGAKVSAYPVPVGQTLNLSLNGETGGRIAATISDLQGRQVMISTINMAPGSNNFAVDVSNLANGMYVLTLTDSQGGRYTQKITKQ